MKNLIYSIVVFLCALGSAKATTYYTCTTASGTNLTTSSDGTGSCNIALSTWNQTGNTVIVRTGSSGFNLTGTNGTSLLANLIVQSGTTVDIAAAGSAKTFTIGAGVQVDIFGTISTSNNVLIINNGALIVHSGGTLDNDGNKNNKIEVSGTGSAIINGTVTSGGDFTITSGGTVELGGTANADVVVIDGTLTGSGTITGTTSLTGTGTVNGVAAGSLSNPISLASTGFTWNGTNWTPTTGSGNIATASLTSGYKLFIDGTNYVTSSGDLKVADLEIASGSSLTVNDGDSVVISGRLDNKGTITLKNNAALYADSIPTANAGTFVIERTITRTGWHHFAFPLKSSSTLNVSNLSPTGFAISTAGDNTHSIYRWNATTSGWDQATGTTTLHSSMLNIYASATGSISLNVPNGQLNNGAFDVAYNYSTGGTNPGNSSNGWADANRDGWNSIINPFTSYLDWDKAKEGKPASINDASYVYTSSGYISWVSGAGNAAARYIGPGQSFFVRNTTNSNGTFKLKKTNVTNNPSTKASQFKKASNNIELVLKGENYEISTYLREAFDATKAFDGEFDAYFFPAPTAAPMFNSVGEDSLMYSVQSVNEYETSDLYLSFDYFEEAKDFSIEVSSKTIMLLGHLYMKDLYTNTVHDLANGAYSFKSSSNAPVQRFQLLLSNSSIALEDLQKENLVSLWFRDGYLNVDFSEPEKIVAYELYSLNGSLLATSETANDIYIDNQGLYIVKVKFDSGNTQTQMINR